MSAGILESGDSEVMGFARALPILRAGSAAPDVGSLSRVWGRAGWGCFRKATLVVGIEFPHPPRSCERVDLPRKRER
jgi:hypothetical protein